MKENTTIKNNIKIALYMGGNLVTHGDQQIIKFLYGENGPIKIPEGKYKGALTLKDGVAQVPVKILDEEVVGFDSIRVENLDYHKNFRKLMEVVNEVEKQFISIQYTINTGYSAVAAISQDGTSTYLQSLTKLDMYYDFVCCVIK